MKSFPRTSILSFFLLLAVSAVLTGLTASGGYVTSKWDFLLPWNSTNYDSVGIPVMSPYS